MNQSTQQNDRIVLAITGASGTVYARRLLSVLLESQPTLTIDLIVSESALRVLREEEGIKTSIQKVSVSELIGTETTRVAVHSNRDIGASIASGSYPGSGMIIAPCSMATLAAIATGYGQNLIHRAADVALKEGRRLVIVPRETPLSAIHLENMLKLSRMGVRVVPAMPGFYHKPQSISQLVDMMVMKILDQIDIRVDLVPRWKLSEGNAISWPISEVTADVGKT